MTNRINKKSNYIFRAYRSELEPDDDNTENQKFGRVMTDLNIEYPNGSMDYYKDLMLDVESLFAMYGNQATKTRDKDIDTPILEKTYSISQQKYYPIEGTKDGVDDQETAVDTNVDSKHSEDSKKNKK